MASALNVAKILRNVLLDLHESAADADAAIQAHLQEFANNPAAERLRIVLASRVQSEVAVSMALAHLADAIVDVLERDNAAA